MCLNCNKSTKNPKFCSKSCAASYNNKSRPKRSVEGCCKRCEEPITRARSYCKGCWREITTERSIERWNEETLESMKGFGNANAGGRYPYIRTLSRKSYLKSGRPRQCIICGYDKHFEVCHIKDVKSFPNDATVGEINSPTNLVALCPNHHWEFDAGLLSPSLFGMGILLVFDKTKMM